MAGFVLGERTMDIRATNRSFPEAPGVHFMVMPTKPGEPEVVHLRVEPGCMLPVHKHKEAARMTVIDGDCEVVMPGHKHHGKKLTALMGIEVFGGEPHGYTTKGGFTAISVNQGILGDDEHDMQWQEKQ
jgi:hypothetical protein